MKQPSFLLLGNWRPQGGRCPEESLVAHPLDLGHSYRVAALRLGGRVTGPWLERMLLVVVSAQWAVPWARFQTAWGGMLILHASGEGPSGPLPFTTCCKTEREEGPHRTDGEVSVTSPVQEESLSSDGPVQDKVMEVRLGGFPGRRKSRSASLRGTLF